MDSREHGLYKARDGIFAGVCKGVADYFDFSIFWTRVLVVVALFITGFWPILIGLYRGGLRHQTGPSAPNQYRRGSGVLSELRLIQPDGAAET